jgi:GAF domain-containing protein
MVRRRRLDVEHLAAAQLAAKVADASAGRWWKALSDAANTTTSEQSLDSLFRDAAGSLKEALEVDAVAILVAGAGGDDLVARVVVGLDLETSRWLGLHAGEGMACWVLTNQRPLVVADLSKIDVVTPVLRSSGLRSVAAVPLDSGEHTVGVLYAGATEQDRFSGTDVSLLQLVADRLASAIERVRLFETERAARMEAERLADRLLRIQTVTSRLAATRTVEEVAAALAESLVGGHSDHDVRWTSVWLLGHDELTPVSVATSVIDVPPLESLPWAGEHPIAIAARCNEALFVGDPEEGARRFPVLGPAFPDSSFAVVPIMLHGQCLGVLAAVYAGNGEFDTQEREFLGAVVAQVAQALERARLSVAQVQLAEVSAYFARAAKVLAEGSDLADTLDRLASLALPALGDICLIDITDDDGRITRMVARHRDASRQELVERLRTQYPPEPGGRHPAAIVIATGQTRWARTMSDEFLEATTKNEEHRAITRDLGFRSYISVPLRNDGATLGCVTLVSVTRQFEPDDVRFVEQLAEQVAAVVHKARRFDIASHTSHVLQATLLPKSLPKVDGLAIHTRYVAASEGLDVGGDFFDVIALPDRVAFMIGDVSGHDRDAAALMGRLRTAARTLVGRVSSPAAMITALQDGWDRLEFDRMATAVFGQIDPATGELALASAGHYPPLLVATGTSSYVPLTPSAPLGIAAEEPMEWRGQLHRAEALLLYTDGAVDERGKGSERSMRDLARAAVGGIRNGIDLVDICDGVVAALPDHRDDDVALLALTLEG